MNNWIEIISVENFDRSAATICVVAPLKGSAYWSNAEDCISEFISEMYDMKWMKCDVIGLYETCWNLNLYPSQRLIFRSTCREETLFAWVAFDRFCFGCFWLLGCLKYSFTVFEFFQQLPRLEVRPLCSNHTFQKFLLTSY